MLSERRVDNELIACYKHLMSRDSDIVAFVKSLLENSKEIRSGVQSSELVAELTEWKTFLAAFTPLLRDIVRGINDLTREGLIQQAEIIQQIKSLGLSEETAYGLLNNQLEQIRKNMAQLKAVSSKT